MYNLSQRFTALLLLFSITLQSCYTPLKMSNKRCSSTSTVYVNKSRKSLKSYSSNDPNPLKIVQSEIDWLQDEDSDGEVIEYKKEDKKVDASQESVLHDQTSSYDKYDKHEYKLNEWQSISFYQEEGREESRWKARLKEDSKTSELDVVCSPGMKVRSLDNMPKGQVKQLIHRIKRTKRFYLSR
jgi:hypothetical protein